MVVSIILRFFKLAFFGQLTPSFVDIGRTGRAGRSGEAITLYTEDDIPFLRNIANLMKASGCEVPSWILTLPKLKGKKHRPRRESISTKPKDAE